MYSLNNEPHVATSAVDDFTVKETYNSVKWSDVCTTIRDYAFSGATCPNPGDPLIIHLRLMSKNKPMYSSMATIFENVLSNRLLGPKYSYENQGKNLGQEPIKNLMGKIIIIADRSNALFDHAYGKEFCYDEMMIAGEGDEGEQMAKAMSSGNPMGGDNLPQPGEGPSKESREQGNYDVLFFADLDEGSIGARVTGDMDPGYGSTSKMIAESALCLIQDCSDLAGGIYTPAPSMGEKLIDRLIKKAGLTFDIV